MTTQQQAAAKTRETAKPRGGAYFVTFANQKGGAGKTTAAAALCAAAGKAHSRALAVDTDPQGTLEDIATAAGPAVGFDFDSNRDPATLGRLRRVAGLYELVIIDTAGNLDSTLESVLAVTDLLIIPCVPERAYIKPTMATAQFAAERGVPYRILINMADPVRREGPVDSLRKMFANAGQPVLESRIRRYVAWPQSQLDGVMITDYKGDRSWRNASDDLRDVYAEIMSELLRMARS